jgi:hypothetical protein
MSASNQKIFRKLLPVLQKSLPGVTIDIIKKKFKSLDQKRRAKFILEVKNLLVKNTI